MATQLTRFRSRVPVPMKHGTRAAYGRWTRSTARFRVLPQFLIVGGQRCGTTSLYKYLAQHPGVAAPPLGKGAHYFDTNFAKGERWYRGHFPTRLVLTGGPREPRITGEGSPYYLFHPCVPARARAVVPDAKIIAMLRDPVARAYSHYWHEVARGFEALSFDQAIDLEGERLAGEDERLRTVSNYESFGHQHWSYLARGRYAEQLEAWYASFPKEQVLVISSKDFFANTDAVYSRILEFLDLPPNRLPRYETYNPHEYLPMRTELRQQLACHFAGPNTDLYRLLGKDFGW